MFLGTSTSTGPGSTGIRNMKRLPHYPRDIFNLRDQIVMFGNASTDFNNRCLLKSIGTDDRGTDLSGDCNQRDTVEFCIRDCGDEIRGPWSACRDADSDLPCRTGITLSGKSPHLAHVGEESYAIPHGGDGVLDAGACSPRPDRRTQGERHGRSDSGRLFLHR